MRKFPPWVSRICLAVTLSATLLVTPRPAAAQWLTTDVPHIGVQLAEFAKKANEWVSTLQNYQVVKDAYSVATTARDISSKIRDINDQVRSLTSDGLNYQHQIQDALRQVQSIKNLRVSNMTDLKNLMLNLSAVDLSHGLPVVGQTQRFTQALATATDADVTTVKEALTTVSTKTGTARTARDSRAQQATSAMSQLALENKAQQDKIEQAFQYKHMADELTASATELQTATNTDNQLTMTDGERLTTQRNVADMLVKAQELREKSSRLLAEAAQKGPAQRAAEKVIADQQQLAGFNAMHHSMHPNEDPDY